MPRLAALASAADNICLASSSVRVVNVRGMAASSGVFDPDGLCVHKGVRAEMGELATVAAVLDTADGNARVGRRDAVDEHTAGVEVARDAASQLDVGGPEIAAQTELAGIGCADGRIDVRDAGQRRNRTEGLLVERGHALGDSAQDGRWVEGALTRYRFAPTQHPCALGDA